MSRAKRLKFEAVQQLQKVRALQEAGDWTLRAIEETGAYLWELYREGSGYQQPGEVVCRHVAAYLEALLRKAEVPCRVDTWRTPRTGPGGQYNGHATLCVRPRINGGVLSSHWYYVDWSRHAEAGLDNVYGASRRIRPGAEGTDLEGLPLTAAGTVDVRWMANHRYGRALEAHLYRVSRDTLRRWIREFLSQRAQIFREVYTGEALALVGDGHLQRLVLG